MKPGFSWSTNWVVRPGGHWRHVIGLKQIWRKYALFCFSAVVCFLALPSMAAAPVPTARELHTSECVAALEVSTDELAKQVKAGHQELRPVLASRLEFGAAFIGDSYLRGERDEARSQALLASALEAQKTLSASELLSRQDLCAGEGRQLLSDSNVVSRAVVSNLAKKRMSKLLSSQ